MQGLTIYFYLDIYLVCLPQNVTYAKITAVPSYILDRRLYPHVQIS